MSDYGMKISEAGNDVKICPDLKTIITSKHALLKSGLSGSGDTTVTSPGTNTVTIAHGLSHIPAAQAYVSLENSSHWSEVPIYGRFTVLESYMVWCYCDVTNLYIKFNYDDGGVGTYTFNYKYFIYRNKGKLT